MEGEYKVFTESLYNFATINQLNQSKMKNLIILLVLVLGFSFTTSAQKDAPEVVKKAFAQKFAAVKSVKWDKESANEWEAEFTFNGKEMTASYDNAGKWLESETEITSKELPAPVSATLAKDFAGYKIGEIGIVEDPAMKGFEVALTKGTTALEVIFDASGKVLKNTPAAKETEKTEKAEKTEKVIKK
jgi:hypothetical protein